MSSNQIMSWWFWEMVTVKNMRHRIEPRSDFLDCRLILQNRFLHSTNQPYWWSLVMDQYLLMDWPMSQASFMPSVLQWEELKPLQEAFSDLKTGGENYHWLCIQQFMWIKLTCTASIWRRHQEELTDTTLECHYSDLDKDWVSPTSKWVVPLRRRSMSAVISIIWEQEMETKLFSSTIMFLIKSSTLLIIQYLSNN